MLAGLWRRLAGAVAALGLLVLSVLAIRRDAAKDAETKVKLEGANNALERIEKGRAAVAAGRASGRDADQRVRDNDDAWQ